MFKRKEVTAFFLTVEAVCVCVCVCGGAGMKCGSWAPGGLSAMADDRFLTKLFQKIFKLDIQPFKL